MPRAFDRRTPPADKDPTAGLLTYGLDDAAATAGTGIREGLPSILETLTGINLLDPLSWPIIGRILGFIANLLGIPVEDVDPDTADPPSLWESVVNVFINPLGFFANLIGGFLPNSQLGGHDASKVTTGGFANGFLPGVLDLLNSLFSGFLGGIEPDTQATSTDVNQAVSGQSQSVAAIGSALAALRARVEALDVTLDVVEEAWEYAATTPDVSKWDTVLSTGTGVAGTPKVDGHQLYWESGGGAARHATFRYIGAGATTAGDRMITEIVLGDYLTAATGVTQPELEVLQNMNAANTQYFRLRMQHGSIACSAVNGGTVTAIGSTQTLASIPGAGSVVRIDNLNTTSARHYQITINAQDWLFYDSTNAVVQGASNRYRGLGMLAGVNTTALIFIYQQACGNVAHWAGYSPP